MRMSWLPTPASHLPLNALSPFEWEAGGRTFVNVPRFVIATQRRCCSVWAEQAGEKAGAFSILI